MARSDHIAGRTALVTGSVQGIGLAIAGALAEAGAAIAVHGPAADAAGEAAVAALRDKGAPAAAFFPADARDVPALLAMADAVAAWRPVDILINNAGIQHTAPLAQMPPETWQAIIDVNLSAAFHTMRRLMPAMAERGYGRVVNIASVHGLVASVNKAPYVAAKFGLVGLTKVAALEYAGAGSAATGGVTVNAVAPGWTETAIIEPQIRARAEAFGGDREAGVRDLLKEKQPSGRTSDPAEIGALVAWLCHPVTHNITGTTIPVDGGWTAQ